MKAHQRNRISKLNERMVDMPVGEIASLRHAVQSVTANISAQQKLENQENMKGKRIQRNK